jgi:single-stranded DNA-binding protein
MAKIEIKGKVWDFPRLVKTEKTSFVSITIMETRNYFDKIKNIWIEREPNWHSVICFDKLSEKATALKQGDHILIKAHIHNHKKNVESSTVYSTNIICDSIYKDININEEKISEDISNFYSILTKTTNKSSS